MSEGNGSMAENVRRQLDQALSARDKPGAVEIATAAVERGELGIDDLYEQVLVPLLVETGERWCRHDIAVWQEHLISSTVRTIVEALYPIVQRQRAGLPAPSRVAVLACPAQEQHEIGLRMLADRLELAGWDAYFLGADVPAEELAAAASALGAELIVLSAATLFHRTALRSYVERLREGVPEIRLVLRGPAFEEDGTGWAAPYVRDDETLLGEGGR